MVTKEYTLVLPAKPGNRYIGGFSTGSISAFYFELQRNDGLFLPYGIEIKCLNQIKKDSEAWKKLKNPLGRSVEVNGEKNSISKTGYFYEPEEKTITWQFEAKCIKKGREIKESEKKFIPSFYPPEEFERGGKWHEEDILLINRLKKIEEPIRKKKRHNKKGYIWDFPDFKVLCPTTKKLKNLTTSYLVRNVFTVKFPKKIKTKVPDKKEVLSGYLKQFLSNNPPRGKLREKAIHEAFLMRLFEKGFRLWNEGPTKNGRYDVLFRDKKGEFVAVEIKRDSDEGSVRQLKDYIKHIKREKKKLRRLKV
jgi:hypothetical protein